MKKPFLIVGVLVAAVIGTAFSLPALAADYTATDACWRTAGGTCDHSAPTKGPATGQRSALLEFGDAPDLSEGDTLTWTYENACNWGGIFAYPSYGSGHNGLWIENTSFPAAGKETDETDRPVHNTNDYGNNPEALTVSWTVTNDEATNWNAHKQLQLGWDPTYNGYSECQGGGDGLETSFVTISAGGGATIDYGMGIFIPQLNWAMSTGTGNGETTSTWSNKAAFIFGNSTTTFPMCAAWRWFQAFDELAETTKGDIDPQAMQIRTNFGYSTSTYFISTTSTAGTTDVDGFQDVVDMIHDWANTIGWCLFCAEVVIIILTRKKMSESHD